MTTTKEHTMSDIVGYDFGVTGQPPPSTRKGGPGKQRTNPFDAPLIESYERKFWQPEPPEYPEGRWYEVPEGLLADGAKKAVDRIRAAQQYCHNTLGMDLGSEVRHDKETGKVVFRGVPLTPRQRKENEVAASTDAANDDAVYEDAGYEP